MLIKGVRVVEQFLSFQGEGPSQGRLAWFWRLAGCPVRCEACDTKYAWSTDKRDKQTASLFKNVPLVVITGGEPLWADNRVSTARLITAARKQYGVYLPIEVETSGTYVPLDVLDPHLTYIVSPKLPGMGVSDDVNDGVLLSFFGRRVTDLFKVALKFVVSDVGEVHKVHKILLRLNRTLAPDNKIKKSGVWIMPKGIEDKDIRALGSKIQQDVISCGFNFSMRMHKYLGCQ